MRDIKILICNIKILIRNIKILVRNIKYFSPSFTIIFKKENAINLRWEYFHLYDLLYYNKLKVTSKKIVPDLYDTFYYNNQKSNKQ